MVGNLKPIDACKENTNKLEEWKDGSTLEIKSRVFNSREFQDSLFVKIYLFPFYAVRISDNSSNVPSNIVLHLTLNL